MKNTSLFIKLFFVIYLFVLIYITLFAWNYGSSFGPVGPGGRNYNMIPFRGIYRITVYSPTLMDPLKILGGNILLFIPFGILIPLIFRNIQSLVFITALGCLLSFSIEISQFVFTKRVADIDDIILNTMGAFVGSMIFNIGNWMRKRLVIFV